MKLAAKKVGWIGVDVGTAAIKIAQIARGKHGWRLIASAVVPKQQTWKPDPSATTEAVSSLDELQAARSLQQGYQGRNVAATLPMSLCDVHRVDRDLQQEADPARVLRELVEISTQQSAEQLQCDYWSAGGADTRPGWSNALTISRRWTDQLAEDIAGAGWNCQAIDGLPLAMTRAVNLVHTDSSESALAALDWGRGRATLCFIEDGQPSYVRVLKGCGLSRALDTLVDKLQIAPLEAERLLEEYAIANPIDPESRPVAELVRELIAGMLVQLTAEIQRSMGQFQFLRKADRPQQLVMFGGGALIKGLDRYLSKQLNLTARNWQLGMSNPDAPNERQNEECLFGTAIGLSALAWEVS